MISMKFSETERQIITYYLKGMRPKEIAKLLGCSVRTVYKATYKYRRWLRDTQQPSPSSPAAGSKFHEIPNTDRSILAPPHAHFIAIPSAEVYELVNYLRELITLIKDLSKSISELNLNIERLYDSLTNSRLINFRETEVTYISSTPLTYHESDPLPSYLKDNPWVDILSKRNASTSFNRS
ncbi:MAG: sigma-70 family RNA polymerase sigma factor [Thermoprotei archaeon]|nr:sigma-70 family RNA polymerase sigma factor [Thermoprotei archaeon]